MEYKITEVSQGQLKYETSHSEVFMKRVCVLLMVFLSANILYAQSQFELDRRNDGHFYFTANVCGKMSEIMLESGLPALLISRDFYERNMKDGDLSFVQTDSKMRLLNDVYNISFKTDGRINVGDCFFDGPIFVLEEFEGMRMPIQYMKDSKTGKGVIVVNLKDGWFRVDGNVQKSSGAKYKLSRDKNSGFPIINATIKIADDERTTTLKGDFIVDFGNASILFLMKQHKALDKAVRKGYINLKDAKNKDGVVVAQGIYAEQLSICGRNFQKASIGVTDKMKSIEQLGFLGVPFFTSPVTLDFDRGVMTAE